MLLERLHFKDDVAGSSLTNAEDKVSALLGISNVTAEVVNRSRLHKFHPLFIRNALLYFSPTLSLTLSLTHPVQATSDYHSSLSSFYFSSFSFVAPTYVLFTVSSPGRIHLVIYPFVHLKLPERR